jgi:N-acyl-D-amino-acid deacylase
MVFHRTAALILAFPRMLGRYARNLHLMPLEQAVHKMTGLTASTFRLEKRGRIAEGCYADIVLFSADRIEDRATFEHPKLPAVGIELVTVNGTIVLGDGQLTAARPGRILRRRCC